MADNNMAYVAAAYGLTWVVLVVYAVRLHGVSRRAREEFVDASREGGERE